MVCHPPGTRRDVKRYFVAFALLLLPVPALSDLIIVDEKDIRFPKCKIEIDTPFGRAKVERSLSEGRYFYQFIYWDAMRRQLQEPLSLNLMWRKSRTSGMSEGPVFLVSMFKNAAGNKKRFAKGSTLRVLPDAANVSETKELVYGPLNDEKSKYREDFELDAAEILDKFVSQEIVRLQIEAPHREGREARIIADGKLKMDFVRAYLSVADEANKTLDAWQRKGGFGCPGVGR